MQLYKYNKSIISFFIDNKLDLFGETLYRHVEFKNNLRNTRQIQSLYTNIKVSTYFK